MTRIAVPVVTLASFLLACGGSPGGTVGAVNATTEANVAAKASEPRTADPTAARPPTNLPSTASTPPTAFKGLGMSGAPAPAAPAPAPPPEPSSEESTPAAPEAPRTPPPKRIGARHVLIQWMGAEHAPTSVVRSRDQAYAVAKEVLRRARAKEDFARLAVEFSDEPNAGARGGSLGRFGHGQMVGAFEDAAFRLQVGEISGIVESPFGFHVIQRTE